MRIRSIEQLQRKKERKKERKGKKKTSILVQSGWLCSVLFPVLC